MEHCGKWACCAEVDMLLDIFPSGEVYLTASSWGLFCQKAEVKTAGENLILTVGNRKVAVSASVEDGKTVLVGEEMIGSDRKKLYFENTGCEADCFPSFVSDPENPGISEADFPNDGWEGVWECNGLFDMKCEMELEKRDGRYFPYFWFDGLGWGYYVPIGYAVLDGELIFLFNDAANRAVFRLRLEDGIMKGSFRQLQQKKYADVEVSRISDHVSDRLKKYIPIINLSRLEILRRYADYDRGQSPVKIEFVLGEKLPECLDRYDLGKYTEGKEGDELVFALLDFICDNFHHDGCSGMPSWPDHRKLQDFVLYYEKMGRTNCRGLSIMLSALLRSFGIRAQHVTCLPYEDPCSDCHVVVDCFLPSGGRVLLDPTFRVWFKDEKGSPVSIRELRKILLENKPLIPSEQAAYNGVNGKERFDMDSYREYMAKNTLRFSKGRVCRDGDDELESLRLFPKNYDYSDFHFNRNDTIFTDEDAFWSE